MRSSRHTLGFFLQVYTSCFEFFSSYAVGCHPGVVYRISDVFHPSFPNVLIGNLSLFYFRPLIETFRGDD